MTRLFFLLVVPLLASVSSYSYAEQLRSVDDFLGEAFSAQSKNQNENQSESQSANQDEPIAKHDSSVAKKETMWLNADLKKQIYRELDYSVPQLRLRYWGKDKRTAWILEEIGKEQPITMGIVVNEGKLDFVEILAYRESRGYEVKYDFFKDQFKGATLVDNAREPRLDQNIDGITGATMSVRAVTKVATLALFLHALTPYGGDGQAN